MKNLISGMVLAVILCGLYATAQQPYVTTTLPSATVKLNGASGGGSGTGTGFTYDAGEDAWIFTPPSGGSDTRILSDYIGLQDAAGTDILALSATQGATTYIAARLAAGAIETRDYAALSATGTITGTNVQCDTGVGAVVGTLDAAAGTIGRFVYVTRSGANTCTVGVESGHTLDGVTDGTVVLANGATKTFKQESATAWVTVSGYPVALATDVTGNLGVANGGTGGTDASTARTNLGLVIGTDVAAAAHGVTTGAIPYASSSTAFAASEQTRVAQDSYRQVRGTNAQTMAWCMTFTDASNYSCLRYNSSSNVQQLMTDAIGTGAGTNGLRIGTVSNDIRFWVGADRVQISTSQMYPTTADAIDLGHVSSIPFKTLYLARGIQNSKSKALVDATATNVWQIAVANNSYEGFTLDYTIFATDGTDRQVRAGSVPVAILNNGGTETCVFGTATDAANTSTGTLTVTFDCTAGTDTVMVRANADTSLASTTTFTIESRPNLTSGTATVTPQ